MKDLVARNLDDPLIARAEAVYNPVDAQWFRPTADVRTLRARLGLNPDVNHISVLAALTPHKGHACFLRMARLVLRRFPRTTFHVVGGARPGSGGHADSLRRLASRLGVSERIRFWGFVGDGLARDILSASDVFVLPSREEGFGLSVAEALACQVPVLVSRLPVFDEVVGHGRTGYLIDSDNYEEFARRAVELLGSATTRKRMGLAGRESVLKRFDKQAFARRMMALYDRTLTAPCRADARPAWFLPHAPG
jgi:glycosyltransferase involved in cell wall biosynthesis